MMMQMLLTHSGLTHGKSAMKPDKTRPIVLVMPMSEMRKVAYSGSTPCRKKTRSEKHLKLTAGIMSLSDAVVLHYGDYTCLLYILLRHI